MAYKPKVLEVAAGGTGAATLTSHGVLIGSSTSAITATSAGSSGQVLQSAGGSADPTYSTATYPATATGTGTILRADGTNWSATTTTYPNTNAVSTLLYASSANVMAALATANNASLTTNGSGVPTWITANTSWTPSVVGSSAAGTASYSVQVGQYIRFGPLVYATFTVTWSSHTGTGNLGIESLPVTPINTANMRFVGICQSSALTLAANTGMVQAVIAGDASAIRIFIQSENTSGTVTDVAMDAAASLIGSVLYFAA